MISLACTPLNLLITLIFILLYFTYFVYFFSNDFSLFLLISFIHFSSFSITIVSLIISYIVFSHSIKAYIDDCNFIRYNIYSFNHAFVEGLCKEERKQCIKPTQTYQSSSQAQTPTAISASFSTTLYHATSPESSFRDTLVCVI